ncbi:TPA: ABC transporter permease [Streptococcus suis]|uniref:ABC transporter permease n=1 Tax=Streptococcus suis TaxID=1307 RepID=UPI000406D758|nr:ABC transporter permease [Streptococcus suis]MCO8202977.1 ABC transporter permease [Streptococcus suis]HEM3502784.1 ABC transporter permease [Streptococcus suis]
MENWKFGLASIWNHKMRSILTMLGIIIGVSSVVVILALGTGMRDSLSRELTAEYRNLRLYYKTNDYKEKEQVNAAEGIISEPLTDPTEPVITEEQLERISSDVNNVTTYYVANSSTGTLAFENHIVKDVQINGVSENFFLTEQIELLYGRKFIASDYLNFTRVTIMDSDLAEKFFKNSNKALNQYIDVEGDSYLVVGVYKNHKREVSLDGNVISGGIYLTNTQLSKEFNEREVSEIYFHLSDLTTAKETGRILGEKLTKLSNAQYGFYEMYNMDAIINRASKQANLMTTVIGAIAGISLLVGGVGVMNIMVVSVTERKREIGLRKAIGAKGSDILRQFLTESILICLLGGLVGFVLSVIICKLIEVGQSEIQPIISLNFTIISVGFSVLIGIVFGALPAYNASRLDPIEALQSE